MAAETEGIQVAFGANIAGLTSGLTAATSGVKEAVGSIEGHFKSLGAVMDNLKAPFMAFTGLLAGGALFKGFISETTGMIGETAKLARQLGITTQEASGLREALDKLGIDSDTYGAAVFKLQIALRTQEEELNRNGIVTRNARGEHLAIQDVMMNGIKRLGEMKQGYDANALSMLMWGRGAKEMQGLMRLTEERLAAGAQEAKEMGTVISKENVVAMRTYKEAMVDVKDIFEAIQVQIGVQLLPKLTSLGQWFATTGPSIIGPAVKLFELLAQALSYTSVQLALLGSALWGPAMKGWGVLAGMVSTFTTTLRAGTIPVFDSLGMQVGKTTTMSANLGKAMLGLVNPWMLVGVAIVAGGVALERWLTSASRAAQEQAKLAQEVTRGNSEFMRLADELQKADSAMRKAAQGSAEYKAAEDKRQILIAQMNTLYPGFLKFLDDERNTEHGIAGAIRLANEERQKDVQAKIAQAQASLALTEADRAQAQASLALTEADLAENPLAAMNPIWIGRQWMWEKKVRDTTQAIDTQRKSISDLMDTLKALKGEQAASTGAAGGGGSTFNDDPKDGKDKDAEQLRAWKDTLTRELEAQGAFFNDSTKMSLDYWQRILKTEKLSNDQRLAIQHEVFKLEKDEARQAHEAKLEQLRLELQDLEQNTAAKIEKQREVVAEELRVHKTRTKEVIAAERELLRLEKQLEAERQALRQQTANANRDIRLAELDGMEADLGRRLDLGQISAEQELAAQAAIEERRYAARKAALAVEMQDMNLTAGERETLRAREAILEMEHQEKLKQIRHKGTMDAVQSMKDFLQPLTSAFESSLQGLLAGTMSWKNAVQNLWKSLGQVLDQMITKMVMSWVTGEGTKTAATQWGVLKRVATETWGAIKSVGLAVWTGLKWVAIKGYEAAAGAYSAIASIPYVGPFLAPAVAAGVLAAVIGLGSKVASAAGGWETVPHDQMAMIHKDEQVLPASYATGLRNLIKNGGGGGQPQEVHQHTWNVNALDAASFEDYLRGAGPSAALVRVQKELVRDGRMG